MTNPDALLAAAERVASRLADRSIAAVVIGASARAAHRYVRATLRVRSEAGLRIIPLAHLIALKLYAGGMKSKADIVEL